MVPRQVRRCPHTLASLVHLSLVCPSLPSCPGGRGLLFPEPGMQAPHLGASLCRYCSLPFTVSLPVGDLPSLPGVDSEDFRIPLRVAHPPRGELFVSIAVSPFQCCIQGSAELLEDRNHIPDSFFTRLGQYTANPL